MLFQRAQLALLIIRSGQNLSVKLEPISKSEVPKRGKYAEILRPIIQEIKKGMNEAYRVDLTTMQQRKRYRIYDALKNAMKSQKLEYDVMMRKGIIYLTLRA